MPKHTLLLLAAALTGAAPLAAQTFALDKCDPSKAAVGYLRGSATVGYTLAKNGLPDTSSVVLLAGAPLSAPELRSAAARQLAACKMKHPDTVRAVTQEIRFDSASVSLAPAQASSGTWTPLPATGAPMVDTAMVVAARDSALEERPRWLSTDRPPHTHPVSTSGPSAAADAGMFASSSPMNSGGVSAILVVGTDGRVMKESVTLVSSDNPQNSSNLLRSLAASHFAPARIAGVAIPSRVLVTILVSANGYLVKELLGPRQVLNGR